MQGPLYRTLADTGATFSEYDGWNVASFFQSPEEELETVEKAAGLVDLAGWGILRLRGSSRIDFVHRLSTNDVETLAPGQGAPTVFLTPIGRILDLAFVLVREDDLLLMTGRGASAKIAAWLQRHIFFNDDVAVADLTEEWGAMGLTGPAAPAVMEAFAGQDIAALEKHNMRAARIAGLEVTVARSVPLGFEYTLFTEKPAAPDLWAALSDAVASVGGSPVGEMAVETMRIAAGLPRYGRELSEDYVPLEAGLRWAISFRKGCYVGQEIVARMDTYQRMSKRLVVVGTRGGVEAYDQTIDAGADLRLDDVTVGQVTSAAPQPHEGRAKALAYVKAGVAEPGNALNIGTDKSSTVMTILALPGEPSI